jgi:magnesium-transporting ATPase (P-type)
VDYATFAQLLLLSQLLVTGYLMGLIWFVQLVHYPLLAMVGEDRFFNYHRSHTRWTTLAVAPAMLVELFLAIAVAWYVPWSPLSWAGLGLVGALWLSTFLIQVPMHGKLSEDGYDPLTVRRLVRSNWLRTVAWTLRGIAAAWMLVQTIGATQQFPPAGWPRGAGDLGHDPFIHVAEPQLPDTTHATTEPATEPTTEPADPTRR